MTGRRTRAAIGRWSRRASYALAGAYGAIVVLSFAFVEFLGNAPGGVLGSAVLAGEPSMAPVFVGYALVLASTVVVRALATRTGGDVVLAAFSTPVSFVGVLGVVEFHAAVGGVYWGGLLSFAAGTLLSVVVLADGVLAVGLGVWTGSGGG
ncbi:hypothetical protein G9C85_05530 [Halorubellus sp. JP-L1]|uniref:hypothetical protein n=1 Tax=Halorubellus sp. JP-L1 TaxID=2715753 RepID=UPI00140D8681|nr:hypothetical protein [Halorubellus sp. JP-L1]NHN41096.1 hypothetical protein [Halorubellus sp. JP-L1]